jgi:aspartate aminotransferase-like enzyme
MEMQRRLFTPGPTPIPEEVQLALSQPIIHHRQADFKEIFRRASENLKYVFQTRQPVLMLTSSGTGAMEAAVVNLLSEDDAALYVDGGKFGERWGKILQRYGIRASRIEVQWGTAATPEQILEALQSYPETKAVFLTHSETSTGTATDVRCIAQTIRANSNALTVVDGISSVGALEMLMDEWDIDVLITASQKGLMLPPGLSFVALSERAWDAVQSARLARFYFDFEEARRAFKKHQTPWTPAISLILGLDAAVQMIRREGLRNVWLRHAKLARGLRRGCEVLGLIVYSRSPSNSLTALQLPTGIDAEKVRQSLIEDFGMILAGGQDHLKGSILRVAHLGHYHEEDILDVTKALGLALERWHPRATTAGEGTLPVNFDPAAGVEAINREFNTPFQQDFKLTYAE